MGLLSAIFGSNKTTTQTSVADSRIIAEGGSLVARDSATINVLDAGVISRTLDTADAILEQQAETTRRNIETFAAIAAQAQAAASNASSRAIDAAQQASQPEMQTQQMVLALAALALIIVPFLK